MAASDRERQAPVNDSEVLRLLAGPPSVPVAELARQQGVRPVQRGQDMTADLWDSDEEFDAFMADLRASRQSDLG
jgi:hypothetical protein